MPVYMKPMSTLALIFAFAMAGKTLDEMVPQLEPYATSALVALEYRKGSSCAGFEHALGIVYMEDDHVSVARQDGKRLTFSVENCKFKNTVASN